MDKSNRKLAGLGSLLSLPFDLISGYLVGLLAPIAALAAIAGGIYLLTRKVPFLTNTWSDRDAEGGQHLSFKLMPPDQAQAAFAREKERIGAELNTMSAEIKTFAEQASRRARAAHEAPTSILEED